MNLFIQPKHTSIRANTTSPSLPPTQTISYKNSFEVDIQSLKMYGSIIKSTAIAFALAATVSAAPPPYPNKCGDMVCPTDKPLCCGVYYNGGVGLECMAGTTCPPIQYPTTTTPVTTPTFGPSAAIRSSASLARSAALFIRAPTARSSAPSKGKEVSGYSAGVACDRGRIDGSLE